MKNSNEDNIANHAEGDRFVSQSGLGFFRFGNLSDFQGQAYMSYVLLDKSPFTNSISLKVMCATKVWIEFKIFN